MNLASALLDARGRGWLGTCDPRLKLAWLAWVSCLCVLLDSLAALAALALVAATPAAFLRIRLAGWLAIGTVLALVVWGTLLSQGLFYDRWPRSMLVSLIEPRTLAGWEFSGLAIYREGIVYGAVQSLRLVAMMLAGLCVCLSTSPERLLAALARCRVPVAIGFVTVTALRFLPAMLAEIAIVRQAQRLRGARRLRGQMGLLLLPVLASALRRSTALAASVTSRGFDPAARRTFYPELRFRPLERVAIAVLVASGAAIGAAKALYWLYVGDLYYASGLRELYDFVRQRL
jgi:energy-coupling factor transport system permease protein